MRAGARLCARRWFRALRFSLLMLSLCCGLTSAQTAPAPPMTAPAVLDVERLDDGPVNLTPYFTMFEDPSTTLTITDLIANAGRFTAPRSPGEVLTWGRTESAWWLRLQLRNPGSSARTAMLELDYARYRQIALHRVGARGVEQSIVTGLEYPFASRPYPNRTFVFPVTIEGRSEQTLYLRIKAYAQLAAPAVLWPEPAFHRHERQDYLWHAAYFGATLALAVVNLLMYFVLRERLYLLYVIYLGWVTFSLSTHFGFAQEFLLTDSPRLAIAVTPASFHMAVASFAYFSRYMLETPHRHPRLDLTLRMLSVTHILIGGSYLILPDVGAVSMPLVFASCAFYVLIGLQSALARQRDAVFYLLAFVPVFASVIAVLQQDAGILRVGLIQIASGAEMLLLAGALADRFLRLRQAREAAQAEALATLQRSERELEARVIQRTAELERSNDELSRTLAELRVTEQRLLASEREAVLGREIANNALIEQRQFVAMASHEFRSPLAVIDSAVQLLAQRFPDAPRAEPVLSRIRRAVGRLARFLDNCLTEDRLNASAMLLHRSPIDLAQLVAEALDDALMRGPGHRIRTRIAAELPGFEADAGLLKVMLLNLLDNAIKYSPTDTTIEVRARHVGQYCVIDVVDEGRGIARQELPLILERYRRGSGTASIPGAGLGLSLVARIVKLHGGEITIDSAEGVGTQVTLKLPLSPSSG